MYADLVEAFDLEFEKINDFRLRPYFYRGYPELLYEEELTDASVTLSNDEKWGLIYGGIRIKRNEIDDLIIIGEIDKWAHISEQVTFKNKFLTFKKICFIPEFIRFLMNF